MADHTIKWTIVNFTCWNNTVHGSEITSPPFTLDGYLCHFELIENSYGKLEVRVLGNGCSYSGDFSLISSNGTVISTKEISYWYNGYQVSARFSELEITGIISEIRKNEVHHQDQLTVRCRIRNTSSPAFEYIRTTINVHQISVKVSSKKFEEVIEGNPIQVIRFLLNDDDIRVQIVLHKRENTYSSVLEAFGTSEGEILFSTSTSVLNEHDAVLKTIEGWHVFLQKGKKRTMASLTKEEIKEKRRSLFITLKIIPRESSQGHFYVDEGVYVAQPNFLKYGFYSFVSLQKSSSNTKIITSSNNAAENPVAVLTKELMCLFQDHDFSDLQLNCGGVSLPVHKAILSARSPVLKRLLSSDMREAASGSVDIEDLDAPTLARFLAFLYTGSMEDLQGESALKLYYAADKYEVSSLKSECVSVLSASVAVSNVCDILSLADRHQDDQLRTVAHDFILRNFNEVLGSTEWENFIKRESLLAVNTVTVLARKNTVVFGTS